MALTFETFTRPGSVDGQNLVSQVSPQDTLSLLTFTKVTFDSSYPTGGEAIVAADLGLTTLREVISVLTLAPLFSEKIVTWDRANSKLTIGVEGAAIFVQAGSASDQSSVIALVVAIGE